MRNHCVWTKPAERRKGMQVAKVGETCHEKGYMLAPKDYKMSAASWRLTERLERNMNIGLPLLWALEIGLK